MKIKVVIILGVMLLITGCVKTRRENEIVKQENKISQETSFTEFFNEGEIKQERFDLNQIQKVYLSFPGEYSGLTKIVAIDFEKKVAYENMGVKKIDRSEPSIYLSEKDVQALIGLLEKYDIQSWKEEYGEKSNQETTVDESGWCLLLENPDCTIEKHVGYGIAKPEKFDEFKEQMFNYIEQNKGK